MNKIKSPAVRPFVKPCLYFISLCWFGRVPTEWTSIVWKFMHLHRIPSSRERSSGSFWIETLCLWVTAPQIHSSTCWEQGRGLFGLRSGKRPLDWIGLGCGELQDPPPKRSFTSGNLIAVYLNYRGWDEKRRANELQVARHVQTITAGLHRAAPGLLDYCMPVFPLILTVWLHKGILNVGRTYCMLFVCHKLNIHCRHAVSPKSCEARS